MTKSYVLFSRAEAGAADSEAGAAPTVNAAGRVLIASLAGTTIEFFDFYIYATAAVLVFPRLFFPSAQPGTATLQSLATFALAFLARPVGSAVFGHFGDRIGRKATLVAALLTMGLSTVGIGLLPTYAVIGIWAPVLLALLRFGQGFGLGGEWGGAVLLGHGKCAPWKGRDLRHVSATGRTLGLPVLHRRLSAAGVGAERPAVVQLGLAPALRGQRCAGAGRPVCAPDAHRDARLPSGH